MLHQIQSFPVFPLYTHCPDCNMLLPFCSMPPTAQILVSFSHQNNFYGLDTDNLKEVSMIKR